MGPCIIFDLCSTFCICTHFIIHGPVCAPPSLKAHDSPPPARPQALRMALRPHLSSACPRWDSGATAVLNGVGLSGGQCAMVSVGQCELLQRQQEGFRRALLVPCTTLATLFCHVHLPCREDSSGSGNSTFMMGLRSWPRSAFSDVIEAALSSGGP